MEIIKNWIFSVCSASIIVSILKVILSDSKMKKTANIFLSLFLLFYMIAPFGKMSDLSFVEKSVHKDYIAEDLSEDYSAVIETAVNKVCEEVGCVAEKIIIQEETENGENVIAKIEIILNDKTKSEIVTDKLKNEYGFEAEVI